MMSQQGRYKGIHSKTVSSAETQLLTANDGGSFRTEPNFHPHQSTNLSNNGDLGLLGTKVMA